MNVKKLVFLFVGGLFLAFGVVAVLASMQPEEYEIVRKIEINAPPAVVFPFVGDLKTWTMWSPWFERDPKMKIVHSEVTEGIGAIAEWESETEGTGKQLVRDYVKNKSMKMELEFYEPWQGKAYSEFQFNASKSVEEGETQLVWSLQGFNEGFVAKVFYLFMDFDGLIGSDYEKGLNSIKKLSEEAVQKKQEEAALTEPEDEESI